jgi:hypothetical protein
LRKLIDSFLIQIRYFKIFFKEFLIDVKHNYLKDAY